MARSQADWMTLKSTVRFESNFLIFQYQQVLSPCPLITEIWNFISFIYWIPGPSNLLLAPPTFPSMLNLCSTLLRLPFLHASAEISKVSFTLLVLAQSAPARYEYERRGHFDYPQTRKHKIDVVMFFSGESGVSLYYNVVWLPDSRACLWRSDQCTRDANFFTNQEPRAHMFRPNSLFDCLRSNRASSPGYNSSFIQVLIELLKS